MAFFLASSAQAIVGKSVSEEIVSFSDLDLYKVEGQKSLQRRLHSAATKMFEKIEAIHSHFVSRIA